MGVKTLLYHRWLIPFFCLLANLACRMFPHPLLWCNRLCKPTRRMLHSHLLTLTLVKGVSK